MCYRDQHTIPKQQESPPKKTFFFRKQTNKQKNITKNRIKNSKNYISHNKRNKKGCQSWNSQTGAKKCKFHVRSETATSY